jgi:hypothetical protein
MQFEQYTKGQLHVGSTTALHTFNGNVYSANVLGITHVSDGVYLLVSVDGNLGIAFNRRGCDECAYVGFSEEEFLSIINQFLNV